MATIEKRRKISVHIDGEKNPIEITVPTEQSAKDMCTKMITEGFSYMEGANTVYIPSRRILKSVIEMFVEKTKTDEK
jgi:hypothetical protein